MLSLRLNVAASEAFPKKTENLSDALRRTLIIEGMTAAKTIEIAVEKTIDLCRKNTRSESIKSVITPFTSPKEVVAKMLAQIDKVKNETQVLTYRASNTRRGLGYFDKKFWGIGFRWSIQ